VDAVAPKIANEFIDLMDRFRSPLGGRYFVHLFSFLCNIDFGPGARGHTRRAARGRAVAYSLSAHQGRDVRGVTAPAPTRWPACRIAGRGASAAIIDLDPKLVAGPVGIACL